MTGPDDARADAAKPVVRIMIADDDPDDRLLIEEALGEAHFDHPIEFFADGQDLLDYLHRRGDHALRSKPLLPSLLLLDLNMPRMDGRETLQKIKQDPQLRRIPVVILTTSSSEEDVLETYDLGANSFITKPAAFQDLVKAMVSISSYWMGIVTLPPE